MLQSTSRVEVRVVLPNEEQMIARYTLETILLADEKFER
jgi:hypothetical protein